MFILFRETRNKFLSNVRNHLLCQFMKAAVWTSRTNGEYEVKLCTCVLYGRLLLERVLKKQGFGIWTAFGGGLLSFQIFLHRLVFEKHWNKLWVSGNPRASFLVWKDSETPSQLRSLNWACSFCASPLDSKCYVPSLEPHRIGFVWPRVDCF